MKQWQSATQVWQRFWQDVVGDLRRFPWRNTGITLRERFREDRLGQTASSLTFTTVMALVPLFTVGLAIFSAFPMFSRFEGGIESGWYKAWYLTKLPALCSSTCTSFRPRPVSWVG